jgi:CysZ protein
VIVIAAQRAFNHLFSQKLRGVVFKSLGLSILILAGFWFLLEKLAVTYLMSNFSTWLGDGFFASLFIGLLLVIALGFLLAPVTASIASIFLDEVAQVVEDSYPNSKMGREISVLESTKLAIKFAFVVLFANIVGLFLLWVPGINLVIFFIINGFLLGREYFQFASMRFHNVGETSGLIQTHSTPLFFAGLLIAGFMMIPLIGFLTPIFAAAMMAHLYQLMDEKGKIAV